jgi:hypothetical protein
MSAWESVYTRRLASFWALVSVPYLFCGECIKRTSLVCIDSQMAFRPLAI